MMKTSIKREQSQAGLSFAERKNFRPKVKNKLLLLLALLMTAATGAWAQQEVLLTTVTATGMSTYSQSPDGVVTVVVSGNDTYDADWGWYRLDEGTATITVTAAEGYTITRCVFKQYPSDYPNRVLEDDQAPFVMTINGAGIGFGSCFVEASNGQRNGPSSMDGASVIEVYGAAPSGPTTYKVTMKDGVKDADKWTVKVGEGQAQALPIGGLKGDGSETVTLQYNGRLKVKGVKATSDAAPAEPAAIINGKFSVSDTKQVYFSKGNLRYVSGAWSFFDNQYDYYATYSADAWDKFGWSNSTNDFGKSTSTNNNDYKNDLVDWGTVPGIGSGWRTLTLAEWQYLFSTRSASTVNSVANARYAKGKVNNVYGIILFPDTYTHPDGVTNPVGINDTGNTGWNGNNYNATDWGKMEAAGCVFLPAAGYRQGTSVSSCGSSCSYRSSTRYSPSMVQYIYFESSLLNLETHNVGYYGQCVRLVREVTE